MDKDSSQSIGCLTVVQIVLITLKLFRLIDISWWLVFIPTYINLGILLIGLVLIILGYLIAKR